MNKDKVKVFLKENLDIAISAYINDERNHAFDCLTIGVYPQSFGRLDVIITSKYGYASMGGVTRYAQLWDLMEKFEDRAINNFYADFFRNHQGKEAK